MADEQQIVGDCEKLELDTVIGFNGCVPGGLKVHPDGEHLIYPLGCAVVVENISRGKQELLWGHTDDVSCIAVSNCKGNYLASGQKTHMGFKADVIVWDFRSRKLVYRLTLHTTKVQAVAFSKSDLYLATLGGQDDGSVVIWNISDHGDGSLECGSPICGSPAQVLSAGNTICLAFSQVEECKFVTGGDSTLRVWTLDVIGRKIRPQEVNMGKEKRIVTCIQMADDVKEGPPMVFAGTTTGDILGINMKPDSIRLQHIGPEKNKFSLGVTALAMLSTGDLLVGTGSGMVVKGTFQQKPPAPIKDIKRNIRVEYDFKVKEKWVDDNCKGSGCGITSIALRGKGHNFFVGTENCQMYRFNLGEFTCDLIKSCHSKTVNDIIFTKISDLFLTCQEGEIRIWHISGKKITELKRITCANMTCTAIALTPDGKAIVSAWNDGKMRVYGFKGTHNKKTNKQEIEVKQLLEIKDAHSKGVTAVACTHSGTIDDCHIVSGGGEGQVRVWHVTANIGGPKAEKVYKYKLEAEMKEHKGAVADIKICRNDKQCVSASSDGTSIIWNLQSKTRDQIFFANTLFNCVCYDPEELQIITSGTDRKIAYWSSHAAEKVREVEGALTGSINAMDLSAERKCFITGGEDRLIKVWRYEEGDTIKVGVGHSGNICRAKIAPNHNQIVSVSQDGAICLWHL